tara:strand:- start:8251 stop:8949 length:699 start_codon:yes stop_codon:yes gene_type:complete
MNILITRPLIDAEDLMGKLFSLGHKIIHMPTLKISSIKSVKVDFKKYDAIILTSANALRNLKVINNDENKLFFCVGSITEKIARKLGYINTISAGGNVNALKNLIMNSNRISKNSKIAYLCGDNLTSELDNELINEGIKIEKIINYTSDKITEINDENKRIIASHPPDIIFVYSTRSAESFIEIIKNYSLYPLMTGSRVMCISNKVLQVFKEANWKKLETFEPGEELIKLEK